MGIQLLDTGNAAESIAYFQRALQLTPNDPELKMSLVAALILERRFEVAIEECHAVLNLHPNYAKAHLNLLIAYAQLGKNDLAMEHGMAAVDAEPNNATTHGTLGTLLAQSSQDNAIEHLKIACKLDSTNREYGLFSGKMLAKDHPQEAIPLYQSILATDPSNVEVQYKLASLHVTCNQFDKAITADGSRRKTTPRFARSSELLRATTQRSRTNKSSQGNRTMNSSLLLFRPYSVPDKDPK